jgi:hypothetical protein
VTGLRLGHTCRTDVLEVFLLNHRQPITDLSLAYTLAIAMRNAVARLLGIETGELGAEVAWRDLDGLKGYAIVLYDLHPSGYVSGLRDRMAEVLHYTRLSLECPNHCQTSCPGCLQHFDTRSRTRLLDRQKALRAFPHGWINNRYWHVADHMFGAGTTLEVRPLVEALTREMDQPDTQQVRLFLAPSMVSDKDSCKRLHDALRLWRSRGVEASIVVALPEDSSDLNRFMAFACRAGVPLYRQLNASLQPRLELLAELVTSRGCLYWGRWRSTDTASELDWPGRKDEPIWRSLPRSVIEMSLQAL